MEKYGLSFVFSFIKGSAKLRSTDFCLGNNSGILKNLIRVVTQFDEFEKFILSVEERDWRIWTLDWGQESSQKVNVFTQGRK